MLENYNQNRYNDSKSGDQEIDWLFAVTEIEAPESDMNRAWENVSKKISETPSIKRNPVFSVLKIAASVAVVAASIFIFRGYADSPELIVMQSDRGKSQVLFPDGSIAVLNNNSKVEFLEEFEEVREVQFSGEAYFDIKKSEKPFVIKMGDVDVRVLGTSFNLITESHEIRVLVDRGLVALEKGSKQVKVSKGQQGVFNIKTLEMSIDTTPQTNIMSWRNGKFSFADTSLEVATTELSEYYDVTFQLSSSIKNCKITANFDNAPLKDVLNVLEAILGVSIERDNSNVRIKGKGCQ